MANKPSPGLPKGVAANLRSAINQAKRTPAPKYVPGNDYNPPIPVHNSGFGRPNFPGTPKGGGV